MLNELRKIGVFVKRNFRIMFTYKLAFSATFLNMLFNFFYLVLFGSMFGEKTPPGIAQYGNYISYLLIGSIGWGFLWGITNTTASYLRIEMLGGTFESILLTPTKISTVAIAYIIFGSLFSLIPLAILFSVGYFLFGIIAFSGGTWYTLIIFILSAFLMAGFGMLFGGLTIWMKNIGQLIPVFQNISMFFSGVYFPITVLPKYLQPIAKYIPFYYSIEGIRKSLMPIPKAEIYGYIWKLLILSISFILIGLYTLHKGLNKAKKDGSLSFY